jgi:hypothetical protein
LRTAADSIIEEQKLMNDKQRHRRLRLLIKKLNKERKKQAKKIDILCNDLIAAQREFVKRLNTISFAASFYESILAAHDLSRLLYIASRLIKDELSDANVTFFLRQAEDFELHMFQSDKPITLEKNRLENCLSAELAEDICKSNKVCTLDDMFAMGLQGNLVGLNKISAVTVPLGELGQSLGFILIYRSSQEKRLTVNELNRICAITRGLSRAIQASQVPLHS